ncbi:unnamed protein product [Xylocopa violacea]|uniref:Uncharacterized protein n=1 Tax=Xylocopa violacea TaxID=135666 RepID=A0ABP1P562_XYLVO
MENDRRVIVANLVHLFLEERGRATEMKLEVNWIKIECTFPVAIKNISAPIVVSYKSSVWCLPRVRHNKLSGWLHTGHFCRPTKVADGARPLEHKNAVVSQTVIQTTSVCYNVSNISKHTGGTMNIGNTDADRFLVWWRFNLQRASNVERSRVWHDGSEAADGQRRQ